MFTGLGEEGQALDWGAMLVATGAARTAPTLVAMITNLSPTLKPSS